MMIPLFAGWGRAGHKKLEDRLSHTLAWALERDSRALRSVVRKGRKPGRPLATMSVQHRTGGEGGTPDIVVRCQDGERLVAVIEVKISAPPTKHQRDGYASFLARKDNKDSRPAKVLIAPRTYDNAMPGFTMVHLEEFHELFAPALLRDVVRDAIDECLGGGLQVSPPNPDFGVWTNDRWLFLRRLRDELDRPTSDHTLRSVKPRPSPDRRWYGFYLHSADDEHRWAWVGFAQGASPTRSGRLVVMLGPSLDGPNAPPSVRIDGWACVQLELGASVRTLWPREAALAIADVLSAR